MTLLEKLVLLVLIPLIIVGLLVLGKDGAVQAVDQWLLNRNKKKEDALAGQISQNQQQTQQEQAKIDQLQKEKQDAESKVGTGDPADFYNNRK
jgi:Tfp pilus assembly protein PilN